MQAREANGLSVTSVDVLQAANEWQKRLKHSFFHTGHLLCGVMQVQSSAAASLRKHSEVTMNSVAQEVQACFASGKTEQERTTRQVKEVIDEARSIAALNQRVEPKDILCALLRYERSVAYQALHNLLGKKLAQVCFEDRRLFT